MDCKSEADFLDLGLLAANFSGVDGGVDRGVESGSEGDGLISPISSLVLTFFLLGVLLCSTVEEVRFCGARQGDSGSILTATSCSSFFKALGLFAAVDAVLRVTLVAVEDAVRVDLGILDLRLAGSPAC